ncbi:MAG: archaetidylserine decarboxylase [Gemmatimonadales bacterium]
MRLSTRGQHLLPQRLLSRIANRVATTEAPWIKRRLIHSAIARFNVDMTEAADPNPDNYPSFNAFFTRALRPGARVADGDPNTLLLPADGRVSQCGTIERGRIFQAKGHEYTAAELLGDAELARAYEAGAFMNIYLSPRDYHRVHMPWTGTLVETLHLPGRLFSVSPATVDDVPRLFARNERLVCHFEADFGPMVVVMVGALLVSGVETVWNGVNIPEYADAPRRTDFRGQGIRLERFAEMARFNYGSTVIALFPAGPVRLDSFAPQATTRLGGRMGVRIA